MSGLLEKIPAFLSLIYSSGLLLIVILLFISVFRRKALTKTGIQPIAQSELRPEILEKIGASVTNRGLRALGILFVFLTLSTYGFHVYWARYAENKNDSFQDLGHKDLRNRRIADATLRGWILDRSGRLENALAWYRLDPLGRIRRDYPMDSGMAHLIGSDRGDPGLERAFYGLQSIEVPEAHEIALGKTVEQKVNVDVRLTIDRNLQRAAIEQLSGRHGAAMVMNPQTGDVLAMYSNPSYSLKDVENEAVWLRLEADKRDNPLVNRVLSTYYVPGSTFKVLTMIAAYVAGQQSLKFNCTSSGYYAQPGAKVILDDGGPSEVHGRIGIDKALEVSCNQYFAQLAVKLGKERMAAAAKLAGITPYDSPQLALAGRKQPEIWNASSRRVARAVAPRESTIVTGKQVRPYDLGLIGYGQGYSGQMTPFQMALIAATVGNLDGKLIKPRIEYSVPPQMFAQVTTPSNSAEMRKIMGLVTMGSQGTARGVFGPVTAAGITSGGKTGTAQKEVPVYDPETGRPKTVRKFERDNRGNIIRVYNQVVIAPEPRIDSWFICIAPLERPQLAISVVIEGGGYGSRAAAPVAAALVMRARDLGLLKPTQVVPNTKNR
jgi:penicillin-binding protein A